MSRIHFVLHTWIYKLTKYKRRNFTCDLKIAYETIGSKKEIETGIYKYMYVYT